MTKREEQLLKYVKHLPTCNINGNWDEAFQAMSDTPERFRDQDWQDAYEEMRYKMKQCTCGLSELQSLQEKDGKEKTDEELKLIVCQLVADNIDEIAHNSAKFLNAINKTDEELKKYKKEDIIFLFRKSFNMLMLKIKNEKEEELTDEDIEKWAEKLNELFKPPFLTAYKKGYIAGAIDYRNGEIKTK